MVYSLCQSIFHHQYGDAYRSSYEPYIWNSELFDAPYQKTQSLFGKTGSLSIEGIWHHLQTSMFVGEVSKHGVMENNFYARFTRRDGNPTPHLAKLIRGNGRMHLFRFLNPQAKFVLMIRNPIDVVNSVKYKFSFYGDDFYPSDFPRFCEELDSVKKLTIEPETANWAEKQAEYCYQMNRAAVEFAALDANTVIFEFDNFVYDKAESIFRLLDFLQFPEDAAFINNLASPTGPTTNSITLSESEFASIAGFDDLYEELCKKVGIMRIRTGPEVIKRYEGKCNSENYDSSLDGMVTNPLRRIIREKNAQIWALERRLANAKTDA